MVLVIVSCMRRFVSASMVVSVYMTAVVMLNAGECGFLLFRHCIICIVTDGQVVRAGVTVI